MSRMQASNAKKMFTRHWKTTSDHDGPPPTQQQRVVLTSEPRSHTIAALFAAINVVAGEERNGTDDTITDGAERGGSDHSGGRERDGGDTGGDDDANNSNLQLGRRGGRESPPARRQLFNSPRQRRGRGGGRMSSFGSSSTEDQPGCGAANGTRQEVSNPTNSTADIDALANAIVEKLSQRIDVPTVETIRGLLREHIPSTTGANPNPPSFEPDLARPARQYRGHNEDELVHACGFEYAEDEDGVRVILCGPCSKLSGKDVRMHSGRELRVTKRALSDHLRLQRHIRAMREATEHANELERKLGQQLGRMCVDWFYKQ